VFVSVWLPGSCAHKCEYQAKPIERTAAKTDKHVVTFDLICTFNLQKIRLAQKVVIFTQRWKSPSYHEHGSLIQRMAANYKGYLFACIDSISDCYYLVKSFSTFVETYSILWPPIFADLLKSVFKD